MLIRKANGFVFHIVSGETPSHFVCLCGLKIVKNSLARQLTTEDPYLRCRDCREISYRLLAKCKGLKVYDNRA